MARVKKITAKQAQQHWRDLGVALRAAGAGLITTGWHEDGHYYVHLDAEAENMPACIATLKDLKYKGTTGRKREFKITKGDIGGARKLSHLNVEAYLKADGKLD